MTDLYYYPNENISISALQKFENCPFSFFGRYFLKLEIQPNDAMTLGIKFQDALNAKYNKENPDEILDDIKEEYKDVAKELFKKSYDFEDIISVDEPMYTDLGLGKPFIFIPDLLTKDRIIENKYTTGYYNKKTIGSQKQATLYYMGVKNEKGFEPKIYYQIFNRIDKTVELLETKRTKRNTDAFMRWAKKQLREMKKCYDSGIWSSNAHKFCDYKNICPLQEKYGWKPY